MDPMVQERTLNELLGTHADRAYGELFSRHYEMLCHFALKYLHDSTVAEQCVMDVFTKMWAKRNELIIKTDIKYYLYASVRNRTMDMHRKTARKGNYDDWLEQSLESEHSLADDHYHWKQALLLVENAIDRLPRECRRIFRMSRVDGMKYHEIASELNLSVKTVETQMTRALKSIRLLRPVIGM